MARILVVLAGAALLLAPAAAAGRISSSPFVFGTDEVPLARENVTNGLRAEFGPQAKITVSCQGKYPGAHAGHQGFHEIHCAVTVKPAATSTQHAAKGTVVYWIDAKKKIHLQNNIVGVDTGGKA